MQHLHVYTTVCDTGGEDKYSNLASQMVSVIGDTKVIIYTDFIRDVVQGTWLLV